MRDENDGPGADLPSYDYTTLEAAFSAFEAASAVLQKDPADAVAFPVVIEAARLAGRLLMWMNEAPDVSEAMPEMGMIPADMMAMLLMTQLPIDGMLNIHSKTYWMIVGEHMGPDWIESYRKMGALMAKTEAFK